MFPAQAIGINSYECPKNEGQRQLTDAEIKESIYHGLLKDDVLQALKYFEIAVSVENGIICLNGHVMNTTSQGWIENALRAIPGAQGMKSNLVSDNKLTLEVAASLEKLEDTYGCKLFVSTSRGVVALSGAVGTENVKLLAEKCVAVNPNVRGVLNNMHISGTRMGLQRQSFVQPGIGAIIYFMDGVFGAIKQVVINPNNRRVVQVIIQGQFSDQEPGLRILTNNQAEILKKAAVIPLNLIGYLTRRSGFLTIKSAQTRQYDNFDSARFTAPKTGWVPPYPYHSEDVLFTTDAAETGNQIIVDHGAAQFKASVFSRAPETRLISSPHGKMTAEKLFETPNQ